MVRQVVRDLGARSVFTESAGRYLDARQLVDASRGELVERASRHPYLVPDLVETGLPDMVARGVLKDADALGIWTDPDYVAARDVRPTDVVGVVPSGRRVALLMFTEYLIYLRSTGFGEPQQLRDNVAYLATDSKQRLQHVHPVGARYTIGSGAAVVNAESAPGMDRVAAYIKASDIEWGPADVFILGDRLDIDLPLGFANRGGVAGVRHVHLDDLMRATQFKGIPSI